MTASECGACRGEGQSGNRWLQYVIAVSVVVVLTLVVSCGLNVLSGVMVGGVAVLRSGS